MRDCDVNLKHIQVPWSLVLLMIWLGSLEVLATGELEDRRISLGVKLFPALLAADRDIASKVSEDGTLRLLILFDDDERGALELVESLARVGQIRHIPVQAMALRVSEIHAFEGSVGGFFLAQHVREGLDGILELARERQVIVFSPFEGDVERGVTGGLMVNARILPYLNMDALQASNIRIKSFFLRIAERYE